MAQARIEPNRNQERHAYTRAADATALGGDEMWVIFANGLSRDDAIALLENTILQIADQRTTWPIA